MVLNILEPLSFPLLPFLSCFLSFYLSFFLFSFFSFFLSFPSCHSRLSRIIVCFSTSFFLVSFPLPHHNPPPPPSNLPPAMFFRNSKLNLDRKVSTRQWFVIVTCTCTYMIVFIPNGGREGGLECLLRKLTLMDIA